MMSGRKKGPSIEGDCEYISSGSDADVSVIRSADGKTGKITIPLSSTLNALKDAINSNPTLGPIKREHQRLFHLGRELKSGNRSLSAIGIGKHGVFSIHLHSLAPKTVNLQSDDEQAGESGTNALVGKKRAVRRKKKHNDNTNNASGGGGDDVIDLAGSGTQPSNNNGGGRSRNQTMQQPHQHVQQQEEKVVELLDSDDSDSDDDVVEIIDTAPKRRRRN